MRHTATTLAALILSLLAFGADMIQSANAQDDGLVGLWTFDEGTGLIVGDSSGNANTGTITLLDAAAPAWGSGDLAGALALKAAALDHVTVPASASLNSISDQITVSALIYPQTLWSPGDGGDGFFAVVQRQWHTEQHPDLFYLGYGRRDDQLLYKWHAGLTRSEISVYALPPDGLPPATGRWVLLVGTYDGSTFRLYVDGVLIGEQQRRPDSIRLDADSLDRPLVIGGEINGSDINTVTNSFDGFVGEVRLYNRALSADEIMALAVEAKLPG